MGRKRKEQDEQQRPVEGAGGGKDCLWAIGEQLKLFDPLRDFAVEFAHVNPDQPYAHLFAQEVRKARSALVEAMHALRQALGLVAVEAREAAQAETARVKREQRPEVALDSEL